MTITDDGKRFVFESKPWLIGKVFAVVFALLAVAFPIIVIASLVTPPREVTIDCSRVRGTCEVGLATGLVGIRSPNSIPIASIERAAVVRDPSRKNESTSYHAVVRTRAGEQVEITEASYHDALTESYRHEADALNAFLSNPSQPAYSTHFVASDTDWTALVLFALLSPLLAWVFLGLWVTRRVEVDRAARTVRVVTSRVLRPKTDRTIDFGAVTELRASGVNWLWIELISSDDRVQLAYLPRTSKSRVDAQRILTTLGADLGVTPSLSERVRRDWGLG